jgi:hypothetical protein
LRRHNLMEPPQFLPPHQITLKNTLNPSTPQNSKHI